ncbi:TetR family transcriptional regulator [Desulfocarbo indianensis]|nr:TetR family transcriptional regulator [Desulfocarbo indianensis]
MDNRQKILAKAEELFAAQGYNAVGVQELAQAADVTKPTLYHYYGSKLGLLQAVLEDGFLPLLQQTREAAQYQGDLPLTLYRLANAYFAFSKARPGFYRLQLSLWFSPPESEDFDAVRPWGHRQQEMLEALFQAAVRDHGNMKGRHRRYAATFLGMLNTLISLGLNNLLELNDELVFNAVHQFMHGIYS